MFEKDPPKPLITHGRTIGDYYLAGFADGHNGKPRATQRGKRAQEAYAKGYDAAIDAIKKRRQQGAGVATEIN